MRRVTFGDLRKCSLPPQTTDEPDMVRAIRMNIDSKHPDRLRVVIPDEMFAFIQRKPEQPAEEVPEAESE